MKAPASTHSADVTEQNMTKNNRKYVLIEVTVKEAHNELPSIQK